MVEYQALDLVFHALADSTRRAMLRRLAKGRANVGDLAGPFAISLAAASKHVKVLEAAGLLTREVEGRTHWCRIEAKPLGKARDWLAFYERFWNTRLDNLERELRRKP